MISLLHRKELIRALVSREMKARYKGSALGLLWSVLTPLFMAVIYAFFFRLLAGRAANTSSIIVGVFAWQFTELQMTARQNGWTEFVSMQNHYNLIYREEEREMNPYCAKEGIAMTPWSPLARPLPCYSWPA